MFPLNLESQRSIITNYREVESIEAMTKSRGAIILLHLYGNSGHLVRWMILTALYHDGRFVGVDVLFVAGMGFIGVAVV